MNEQFKSPKTFSEILDQTFRLSKERFTDFFMILLILTGPIYIIQAAVQLFSGTSFFRAVSGEGPWYEQFMASYEQTATVDINWGTEITLIVLSIISTVLIIVAEAAIIFAVNHIRNNETYTVAGVIKKAFSRFWPLFWSSILYFLILMGLMIVPMLTVGLATFVGAITESVAIGIILGVVLFLGAMLGLAYLLTRWGFYFGSVTLKEGSPGLTRSWRLTRKRTWVLMGLYIVFFLIVSTISFAIEFPLTALLGYSVIFTIISNLVTLFTTIIFSVGYAVMYFDSKTRHDADDLKELLDDYNESPIIN